MLSDRRQTLQDVSNVPRRLTLGAPDGKAGRLSSLAALPPESAHKPLGRDRPSSKGTAVHAPDPRGLRALSHQRPVRQRIINYAARHNFGEPLDGKKLGVQVRKKQWEELVLFLIGKIDPCRARYGTPGNAKDKIEGEVEAFLKMVQYPAHLRPTQSALFTPGNENSWYKLLGVLDWIVCYLEYREKVAQSPTGWRNSDPAVFTRFAGECLAAFLVGDDTQVERLTVKLQQEIMASGQHLGSLTSAAEKEATQLQEQAREQAALEPQLHAARRALAGAQSDALQVEASTRDLKDRLSEMQAVTRGAAEAEAADHKRLARLREAIENTRAAVAAQPLTLAQAQQMLSERAEQQRQLAASKQATQDKAAMAAQAAASLASALDHVDARVQVHNVHVDELRLDTDAGGAVDAVPRLNGIAWRAFVRRDAAQPSAMVPSDSQAVKAALMTLQRHHKERQTKLRHDLYCHEIALQDGASAAQEASEGILQLQHKAAQMERRLAEAQAKHAQDVVQLEARAEALRQQAEVKQGVIQGGSDGASSDIEAATRILVDLQARHDDEWRLQSEALFRAADVLQQHKERVKHIMRQGKKDLEAICRQFAVKPQLTQKSVLLAR